MDEVNKVLNDYISIHNKLFDISFLNFRFVIEFDNNFLTNIQTEYFYNTDLNNINRYLLYEIDCFKSRGQKIYNINQMTNNIISDRCNMTYERYINQPKTMCERKINMNIARNLQVIIS